MPPGVLVTGHDTAAVLSGQPRGQATRGEAHLWLPRGVGNAGLLLALALDRDAGCPDNCTAIGRMFGVDRGTVREWRRKLEADGLVGRCNGFIVATDLGRERLKAGCDPLPRPVLRARRKPSPPVLRACSVVYTDAVGWQSGRRGCRSDAERAALAGVDRKTVIAARRVLAASGLVQIEELRRGRADLRRARLTQDRRATHGRPMSEARAKRLATCAARGRSRLREGGGFTDSEGAAFADPPMQSPMGTLPMQAPLAPQDGAAAQRGSDGCATQQQPERRTPATATPAATRGTASAAEVLRQVLPDLPAAIRDRTAEQHLHCDRVRERLARADLARLRRMPVVAAIDAVLGLADVDRVPNAGPRLAGQLAARRRRRAVALAAAGLDADDVLEVGVDVATDPVRSVGAVVARRCARLASGSVGVRDVVRRSRRDLDLDQRLAMLRGDAPERRHQPEPRDHDPHRRLALRAAAEAAQRGDWVRVDAIAYRHDLSAAEVANEAGVFERELQQQLDELARERLERFPAGRATA